jgi:cytochrome b involved in lipid metabolism
MKLMKKYKVLFSVLFFVLIAGFLLSRFLGNQVTYTVAPTFNPSSVTPEPTTPITISEIRKHNSAADCWTAVEGSVYDMTRFVDIHPGQQGIVDGCGTDATLLFNSEDNHTPVRRDLMKMYKIGILVDNKTE